jgi:integrase
MQHEITHIHSPLPNTYAIITTTARPAARNNSEGTPKVAKSREHRAQHSRDSLTRALELLLGSLRGEALVAAMLAYGLGVRVSQLRTLRVRDICLKDTSVFVMGRYHKVPEIALEDLREHLHDRICGREAPAIHSDGSSDSIWRRDDLLFSAHAFDALLEVACMVNNQARIIEDSRFDDRFDSAFKVLGRLHRRNAAKFGVSCASPLALFDKGPRIVRRGRGGAIDAYYVWRAARELF